MPDLEQRNYTGQTRYPSDVAAGPERAAPPAAERPEVRQREEQVSMEIVSGGSMLESIAGAATVILAIIGLATAGVATFYVTGVATTVLGAALIFFGAALASRFRSLLTETGQRGIQEAELGTGVTLDMLGGLAGIVLGILSLVGVAPVILTSAAILVFGGSLLLSSGTVTEMNDLMLERARVSGWSRRTSRGMTLGAAGIQALVGVAAVVLGILALVGIVPGTLVLVGLLCTGAGVLLAGGAVSTRLMTLLTRAR